MKTNKQTNICCLLYFQTPFASLCAFAIFKLYQDWTEAGMEIPDTMYDFHGSGFIRPPGAPDPYPDLPAEPGVRPRPKKRLSDNTAAEGAYGPFKYFDPFNQVLTAK